MAITLQYEFSFYRLPTILSEMEIDFSLILRMYFALLHLFAKKVPYKMKFLFIIKFEFIENYFHY